MKSRFGRFAWAFLAYLLFVILFGAWVRITHAGAGCGSHWPTCNGEVVPLSPSIETVIEFTHRLTSGVLGPVGIVFLVWASKQSRRVFVAAAVTVVFIVIEALVGAGLVLRELVADDASLARAVVISFHLVNTLILTAAASLTAWWTTHRGPLGWPPQRSTLAITGLLGALVLTSMTGAVTALGDTLFPVDLSAGLLAHVPSDLSPESHFLVRLRIIHPIVAVGTAGFGIVICGSFGEHRVKDVRRLASWLRVAILTQVGAGLFNVLLAAPGWMQLAHLLIGQLVWILAILLMESVCRAWG